ncbi:MAG: hypothetical protein LBI01_06375 [Elusimicrobium sp.]|jgi:Skp family chaperone for outer membrane proteins|nr:hypothetical protein [Elusimicrobium sp.]
MKKRILVLIFLLTAVISNGQENGGVLSAAAPPPPQGKLIAAYLDINYCFKNHPWTNLTKEALQETLRKKADEIENAKKDIAAINGETASLEAETDNLKPFYETSYSSDGPQLLPQPQGADYAETADALSRFLVFSGADIRFNSPVDAAALAEQNKKKIADNMTAVREKEIWIEKQKFDTTNQVKKEEAVEVQEIMQDIYEELKLFALKRNIAIIVNKDDILYGQKPVDITQEFTDRLRKTKKEKSGKKDSKKIISLELDAQKAPQINSGAGTKQ